MKAILFSLIIILASCTKHYDAQVQKESNTYIGNQIVMLQTNVNDNYRITTYVGNNTYTVYVNVDKARTVIDIKAGTPYFFRRYQNGVYLNDYIIQIPPGYSIIKYID